MRFAHPEHPGRAVRLAYCMNLHAGESLDELLDGVREITLPLRDALSRDASFGVGMYFPGKLAQELTSTAGEAGVRQLASVLRAEGLEPFTFNAFPYGDFHTAGLKQRVFEPTWTEPERLDYSVNVARLAAALNSERDELITISTHPGRFGAWEVGEFERAAANIGRALTSFAELRNAGGPRILLALEAEPRAVAGTTPEVASLVAQLRDELRGELGDDLLDAHLGVCLDACHSAVEFEEPAEAVALALGAGFGKLQFSSAIRLQAPARNDAARTALLGLDEPRYLHQTTGRRAEELLRVDDLPQLAEAPAAWRECDEWRTHFHVPVDLEHLGADGLGTTRALADELLDALLAEPTSWSAPELQLEIETYTWDILPGSARGAGALVDGLTREYQHVIARLARAGWTLSS